MLFSNIWMFFFNNLCIFFKTQNSKNGTGAVPYGTVFKTKHLKSSIVSSLQNSFWYCRWSEWISKLRYFLTISAVIENMFILNRNKIRAMSFSNVDPIYFTSLSDKPVFVLALPHHRKQPEFLSFRNFVKRLHDAAKKNRHYLKRIHLFRVYVRGFGTRP